MTKPLVSIIVPVFNAGRFLNKTLESLCGQDYWELEILCIDDGSKDDSADIIKSFEKKDQRVKYIPQANAGPGAARNHGIELSNGEYIVFQDADDLLHKQALSILVKMAEEYHADVTICGFQSCGDSMISVPRVPYPSVQSLRPSWTNGVYSHRTSSPSRPPPCRQSPLDRMSFATSPATTDMPPSCLASRMSRIFVCVR